MPWKCPACQTQIRHDGPTPQPKRLYRCHVCRLELVLDEQTNKLAVAPRPPDKDPRRRGRGHVYPMSDRTRFRFNTSSGNTATPFDGYEVDRCRFFRRGLLAGLLRSRRSSLARFRAASTPARTVGADSKASQISRRASNRSRPDARTQPSDHAAQIGSVRFQPLETGRLGRAYVGRPTLTRVGRQAPSLGSAQIRSQCCASSRMRDSPDTLS